MNREIEKAIARARAVLYLRDSVRLEVEEIERREAGQAAADIQAARATEPVSEFRPRRRTVIR